MKIRIANSAGFCYGVRRAVELAEGAARSGEPCVMLGPIIHNQDMMDHLARHGLRAVVRPEEVPEGSEVIIRSHGESRAVHEGLHARGVRILDATCPNVTRIHQIVARAEEQGRQPIIIGTRDHPEVLAIAGWCCRPVVLSGAEELENWLYHYKEIYRSVSRESELSRIQEIIVWYADYLRGKENLGC